MTQSLSLYTLEDGLMRLLEMEDGPEGEQELELLAGREGAGGCPTCHGDGVMETAPAGAGHADDLVEYVPCPDCRFQKGKP